MYTEKKRMEIDAYRIMVTVGIIIDTVLVCNALYQFGKLFAI